MIVEAVAAAKGGSGRDASTAVEPFVFKSPETIRELQPDLIDVLRVNDRLAGSDEDDDELARSIRANGQQTPIIVRLSNEDSSRYELAAGGRRLKIARDLGTTVKAVVRLLDNEEMVLAQAIENVARRKLSYIERAIFAAGLDAKGYHRDVITAALDIDETERSRITRQVHHITLKIIEAIGAAPQIGRTRWAALAEAIKQDEKQALKAAEAKIAEKDFSKLSSNERFSAVLEAVRGRRPSQPVHQIILGDGVALASIKRTKGACTLRIDESVSPGFADYLTGRLEELHAAFGRSSDRIGAVTVATPGAKGSKRRSTAGRKSRPAE